MTRGHGATGTRRPPHFSECQAVSSRSGGFVSAQSMRKPTFVLPFETINHLHAARNTCSTGNILCRDTDVGYQRRDCSRLGLMSINSVFRWTPSPAQKHCVPTALCLLYPEPTSLAHPTREGGKEGYNRHACSVCASHETHAYSVRLLIAGSIHLDLGYQDELCRQSGILLSTFYPS